jgi:hypothetical protein
MKHRHLTDDVGLIPAAIDDILDRDPADWSDLWRVIEADPFGQVAEDVLRICAAHAMYGTSRLWPAMIAQVREERSQRSEPIMRQPL